MFKKFMAMLLAVIMVASMTTVVMADDPATVKDALREYAIERFGISEASIDTWLENKLNPSIPIDVATDIEVKETGTSTWTDGPLTVVERQTSNIPTFDYKAVVDMSVVKEKYDGYIALANAAIDAKGGNDDNKTALRSELAAMPVSGEFVIQITVPAELQLPASVESGSNMDGFNAEAKTIFYEKSRSVVPDTVDEKSVNIVTVTVGVGHKEGSSETPATKTELDTYLGEDLILTCEGVQPTAFGTYQVTGQFTGYTDIDGELEVDDDELAKLTYQSEPKGVDDEEINHNPDNTEAPVVAATIIVKKRSGDSSGGSSSNTVTVQFIEDGKVIKTVTNEDKVTVDLSTVTPEEREGFTFSGWYLDKELTQKATSPLEVTKDTKVYAKWVVKGPVLQTEDHFAYIIGYTDGTVRPLNNIIREEVAAIFFRLLTEEAGEAMHEEIAPYSDVPQTKWSSTPIATLAKGGYITGRPDGTFAPEADITRAEFATIAARFSGDVETRETNFSDVDGHWAESYIKVCVANGWITGYTDGTFKPDQNITRAEAMAIVNRMLGRAVDAEGIKAVADDIYYFGDNPEGTWCYYIVLEATNSHDYDRAEGETYETWTKVTEIRDWAAYEK